MSANPLFDAVVDELVTLHDSKNADYGAAEDPFKNFRGAEAVGVPAWIGAEIRMGDKTRRIEEFCKKGKLQNEGVRDSLIDRACYAIIQVALYDQAQEAVKPKTRFNWNTVEQWADPLGYDGAGVND